MRIRFKKGAVILAAIAGAAVATALTVYNVNNQGSSVNVSDMEHSGLLNGLGNDLADALYATYPSNVVADADSVDTAASAGVMGGLAGEDDKNVENSPVADTGNNSEEAGSADISESVQQQEETETAGDSVETAVSESLYDDSDAGQGYISGQDGVQTYVEIVPETRTETVVDKQIVSVERPVTVIEEVTEEVVADPVYFYSETGTAAAAELTTIRRTQEKLAAQQADMERLKAAAGNSSDEDWKFPDEDYNSDGLIVFE